MISEDDEESGPSSDSNPSTKRRPLSENDSEKLKEELLNFDRAMDFALKSIEQTFMPRLFRHTAIRNFLSKTLAQQNPELSIAAKTVEYFVHVFVNYMFQKAVFDYWNVKKYTLFQILKYILQSNGICYKIVNILRHLWFVKNNVQDFQGWPEAVKMDHFMECGWNFKEFEQQLTFLNR